MEYGQIVATRGIVEEIERSAVFATEIATAFKRFQQNDWGNLCEEDRRAGTGSIPDRQGNGLDHNRVGQIGNNNPFSKRILS